jgi:hypothetical protein
VIEITHCAKHNFVTTAQAGIQFLVCRFYSEKLKNWIPAFAGMTAIRFAA